MLSGTVDGRAVRALREDRELTGRQVLRLLEKDLGQPVHPTTLSKIETGHRQPSARLFGAICRALQCDKEALLSTAADAR